MERKFSHPSHRDIRKVASSNFDLNDQMLDRMSNRLNKSALSKFSQIQLNDANILVVEEKV